MAKDVVKKEESLPAQVQGYGEDAGAGFEGTSGKDLSVPFIGLLQSNSPQVEASDGSIRAGMMINTVTGEIIKGDVGFGFIPVHKEEAFVEWIPRLKGGGFVALHDSHGEVVKEILAKNGGSRIPPKGEDGKRIAFKLGTNELVETFYVYGLLTNIEGTEVNGFAVISFTSTKIKPYRDWLTSMYLLKGKPPMFANRALFKTKKQVNDNQTFYNFDIKPLKETWADSLIPPNDPLLAQARDFREMVITGLARADFASQQNAASGGDGDAGDGENAPF